MSITVELPAETEQKLRDRAAESGQEVATLARELIERGIASKPTLDEILSPFRRQVKDSQTTDEELSQLFEEARDQAWRAKKPDDR
jgi:hypothetical protein